ncbi:MAG: TIGR03016 family PEP-CTERM system-associated outer membrane protein [Betaproteobacteria bacterium]
MSSDASFSWLQWAVEVFDQRIDFQQGRDTTSDRVRGVLTYNIDPQFRVLASAGAERNDFVTLDKKTETTYGGGFEWAPSQRTDVFANWEHRFFGSRWDYGLRHRTPGLSLSLVDSRDITTDAQRLGTAGSAVAYDLLFNALATRIPDPAQRAIETQRLLQQGGIPADLNLPADFLTSGIFVSRNQQASVALLGARNTAALTLYRLMRTQLEGSAGTPTGLADGRSTVTERGASLALSHRLTPLSSLTALTTWRRTTGNASSEQGTRQWDARLLYTTQFGRKTSGTVEFRHVRADSDFGVASDYRENALIVSLLVQF